jgi:hypothetical protein
MLRIGRGEAAGPDSLRQVGRFADIFERSDEIVKELDRNHDRISTPTHILGDFDELAALVLFQIKKKNLPIREDFLRMDGALIGASFFTVVTGHGLPPQHVARANIWHGRSSELDSERGLSIIPRFHFKCGRWRENDHFSVTKSRWRNQRPSHAVFAVFEIGAKLRSVRNDRTEHAPDRIQKALPLERAGGPSPRGRRWL